MSSNDAIIPAVNLKLQYAIIRDEIDAAIIRVLDHQHFVLGEEVGELERAVAALHGCEHAVGCASGSDALLLTLLALGVGTGDAVIVPPLTFFATAGAVVRVGAKPIFVDINPHTFNMDPAAVAAALAGPKHAGRIKAMMPVHLYGQCADMEPLLSLARTHGLQVIEDAAQAVLATCNGKPAGSFGSAGCFSFYPTKNLSGAGDGGMVTTRDAEFAARLRMLRNHGSLDRITYREVGVNSRLDTLQAAILLVKLKYIRQWTEERQSRATEYRKLFAETFGRVNRLDPNAIYPSRDAPVVLPYEQRNGEHVYHQFTIRALRRDELADYLHERGIDTAIYYPVALHQQPGLQQHGADPSSCPVAARAAQEVLSLPIYPELTAEQQRRVVAETFNFYR
jgi:dTDP-4-amino-4,6-dideoxygalactose transaminase